jgi:hypothetical protein
LFNGAFTLRLSKQRLQQWSPATLLQLQRAWCYARLVTRNFSASDHAIPAKGIGLLIAVDAISNIFATTLNDSWESVAATRSLAINRHFISNPDRYNWPGTTSESRKVRNRLPGATNTIALQFQEFANSPSNFELRYKIVGVNACLRQLTGQIIAAMPVAVLAGVLSPASRV